MADDSLPASPTSDTPPPRTTGGGFRWEPPTAEELQNLMPGYTIEKILGRGGMGAVYRGIQTNLDRPVAIKILPPGVEKEDASFAERFKNEAKVMAKLMHPGVVSVFDFGTTSAGQLYFVMEYVDGTDVSQMIAAQRRLPPEHALAITAHVCDALQAAHELGIVHRDIKPANVLINMKGQVKVADFGLAKIEEPGSHGLTKTGYAMGTPDFVAPEALMLGSSIDGRADLYAVGVMLYQMLTGNIPRGAFKPASVLVPGLDPRFDQIILKAMQHDRAERHQSAMELRRELDVILTVPLIQHNAPASAAIPVTQVMQTPAQRSAVAQKPVGKAPAQGSAGTPARNQSPGGAAAKMNEADKSVRAPLPSQKSKAPLFIGLGAVAAIAVGAFVMFSGGKKTPSATVGDSSPSSKPASVESSTPKPVASTAPKSTPAANTTTSVSKSPPLPASQSSNPKFPAGQWVKVFTKAEELPQASRSKVKDDQGWLVPNGKFMVLPLSDFGVTNSHGIRARIRSSEMGSELCVGNVKDGVKAQKFCVKGIDVPGIPRGIRYWQRISGASSDTNEPLLRATDALWPRIKSGDEYTLELAVVGDRLIARCDGRLLTATDKRIKAGAPNIVSDGDALRDIEVINLDGLPEAEALKILGVDEKGNDLRKSGTISSSPTLPVSKSSEQKFPPGQWVKLAIPSNEVLKVARATVASGNDMTIPGYLELPDFKARNLAVRGELRSLPEATNPGCVQLRHWNKDASPASECRHFAVHPTKLWVQTASKDQKTYVTLSRNDYPFAEHPEQWASFEFAAVGDTSISRLDGSLLQPVGHSSDAQQAGSVSIQGLQVRNLEVINLDGLPEAEALKILGVDEKGNDLRKPAAVASAVPAPAVSKSSDPKFPAGQWVKVFTKLEELPTDVRNGGGKIEDGWITGLPGLSRLTLPAELAGNYALRATYRKTNDNRMLGRLQMRREPVRTKPYISFGLGGDSMSSTVGSVVLQSSLDSKNFLSIFSERIPTPIEEGDVYKLELGMVGATTVARFNDTLSKTVKVDAAAQGAGLIGGQEPVRDIEVMNLDGLSEAEALKLLGVDEKGNDLRALAAKQEQQQMEQAKAVDAMAAIPELKTLHEQFVKLTAERVTAPFEADVAKLNAGYVGGIDRKIAEEKAVGHLDGIIVLEAEKKLLADQQPIPAEDDDKTTANLKALRAIYRAAYAKIEAARVANLKQLTDPLTLRLKQLEADLTKKDRVPDAKTVREYREKLSEGGAGVPSGAAQPDRNATNGGAAATMNDADKSVRAPVAIPKPVKIKPDAAKSRLAAEYALSKGAEISIDQDGTITPVKKVADLPKGRWGLHRVKFMNPASDEDLQAVTRAVELKELLCNDRVADSTFTTLAPIGNTPGLKILLLKRGAQECSAEDARALLQSADTLEQLTWLRQPRNDTLLQTVTACQNLNFLYLPDTELTDDDLDQLRSLPLLRSFSLRGSRLTDAGARHLAKFKSLIRLIIADAQENGATPLTPAGLATITKAHGDTLIQLNIGSYGSPHTEGMLRVIATDCPALEQLTLRGEASPEALAGLSKLKKLKQLDFGRSTGKPIPLSVAHCQAVGSINSLENIGAYDCDLTDAHLQALAGLKSLKSLNINRNPGITDASVPVILGFEELESLSLGGANLTPAGFIKLTGLKKLKTLSISDKGITDSHLAQFKAALPGCSITR